MNIDELKRLAEFAVVLPSLSKLREIYGMHYSPYYNFMFGVARAMTPCLAVELGVEKGRASASLAVSSKRNCVIGVDTVRRDELNVVIEGYPNFTFIHAPSMPVHDDIPHGIDILHIDTEHSYARARNEFNAYKSRLSDIAVVLFDDTHAMDDGVLRFFNELPYEKFTDDRLHPVCGYGVLLYGRKLDEARHERSEID